MAVVTPPELFRRDRAALWDLASDDFEFDAWGWYWRWGLGSADCKCDRAIVFDGTVAVCERITAAGKADGQEEI